MHHKLAFYMHDLSGGGVEKMRLALIAELRARGASVTLIVARLAGPLLGSLPPDLDVIELSGRGMLRSALSLARAIRRLRPDFLVSSLDHNNVAAMLAGRLAGVETRVIICQHNALSAEARMGWRYRAVPWLYWVAQRWAKGIVAVSNGVADDLARVAAIPRHRITTIYNPVLTQDFDARAAEAAPHPWLADARIPVFVFVGRLSEQKNPALLLRAFSSIAAPVAARLIVLGDGPLLAELQALTNVLGLDDRVAFVGFQVNPLPWIRRAHCLVLTSRYEGFGNVLIEALACGTQAIATDCPHGPREALQHGAYGELVPVDDPRALADAMLRAVHRQPDRQLLTRRAALFTASSCADAHLALFAGLITHQADHRRPFGLALTRLSAAAVIGKLLAEPSTDRLRLVVTPNIDHVRLLRQDSFAAACQSAEIICPDGLPILLYARLCGFPLRTRVTGCALFRHLATEPAFQAKRTFIVVESKATEAAARCWARAQGLPHVSVFTAPAGLQSNFGAQINLVQAVRAARPDILILTLGAPVSEVFLFRHRYQLPPCWAMCVGQAVRVHLGLARPAPVAWQNAGFEWLWRLIREPRRLFGRYARAAAWFPVAVMRDVLTQESKQSFFEKKDQKTFVH